MCNFDYYHRKVALNCYAKEMESVVLMSDHVGEEHSKALASELSTENEEGKSWVKQPPKLFPMCVLKGGNGPAPDPTLS